MEIKLKISPNHHYSTSMFDSGYDGVFELFFFLPNVCLVRPNYSFQEVLWFVKMHILFREQRCSFCNPSKQV